MIMKRERESVSDFLLLIIFILFVFVAAGSLFSAMVLLFGPYCFNTVLCLLLYSLGALLCILI